MAESQKRVTRDDLESKFRSFQGGVQDKVEGSKQTLFALNLDIRENRHIGSRLKLAEQLLRDIGAI